MLSMKEFGELIATKRKELGYTQEAFAGKLGITPQAVSKWENGIGYPDITLFPAIADVFGMSIDELFGREPVVKDAPQDDVLQGEVVEEEDITENDNEEEKSGKEKNNFFKHFKVGRAKISIRYQNNDDDNGEEASKHGELEAFDSIDMELHGACDVEIIQSDAFEYEASGSERFLKSLKIISENGTLKVVTEKYNTFGIFNENNELRIYTALDSGKRLNARMFGSGNVEIGHHFDDATISIHGSGDINGESFGNISATVSGSGDIDFASANTADIKVSGSGDVNIGVINKSINASISGSGGIDIDMANDATIGLSGSGDACIGEISGYLVASMSGSGDVTARGSVESLKIVASGSCDFDGSDLTTVDADITATGPCDIEIDRIIGKSVEKIDRIAELRVNQRG